MDYKKIIENIGKYHFLILNGKKIILLSSNKDLKLAKEKLNTKIQSKLNSFIDKHIIRLKLSKIKKKNKEKDLKSKIKLIGGPIKTEINIYKVNKNGKLKKEDNEDRENHVYFTTNFLEKNKKIKSRDLKKIAYATIKRKLNNTILAINTIDNLKY